MIRLKTDSEIKTLQEGGKILASVMEQVTNNAKAGIKTKSLDQLAKKLILEKGAEPSFSGYQPSSADKPYPANICASVNEVVVHGLPSDYKLQNGDVLKLDFGVKYKNLFTDAAITIPVGKTTPEVQKLIEATKESLFVGIKEAKAGNHLGNIGWAINNFIEKSGFKIIRVLTGHGVGFDVHEDPVILNYGEKGEGIKLEPGLIIAIEPMVSLGSGEVIQRKDGSFATADNSISAHFEHTIAITQEEPLILTSLK